MRNAILLALAGAAIAAPAAAQTNSITLYELPAYLGRSVTITADTADLATQSWAKRAQSARVTGQWQVCGATGFGGSCQTIATNQPLLSKAAVVSLRPASAVTTATGGTAAGTTGSTASTTAALDLDSLDVGGGTDGQDVSFYAKPALGGTEVSAGTNDTVSASAFCKLAGASSASYAGRARVQASNLIDIAAKAKVRGYALRDVVCKR